MIYGASELARSYRTVRSNTIRTVEEIPEEQLGFAAAPGMRTVRQLVTHIAMGDEFARMMHGEGRTSFEGINIQEFIGRLHAQEQQPRTKAELLALLRDRGDSFAAWLDTLTDVFLSEALPMPNGEPPTKTRLELLLGVKEHEMHHRGQLMLIQRMLGIVPHLTRQMQERFAAARS